LKKKLHYHPQTNTLWMNYPALVVILLVAFVLVLDANADYKSLSVDTNSSHWSIYRESNNISFNLSSSVEGKISPVESRGRILSPYQSYYEEVGSNDVRLRQRTNALEGDYKSSDEIKLQSVVYLDAVEITTDKPAGTNIYTIEYKNENWPVFLRVSRTLAYSGQQINNREFEGNNGDFVGSNFLYNHELSKEQISVIWLQRANATVLATDEAILLAEFKPTRYLGYLIRANSTGIADLSYRQRDFRYDVKHQTYPAITEGEERYYGAYNLARKIEMRSLFEKFHDTDDADHVAYSWLPCCYDGWRNMEYSYQKSLGTDARGIFDCTCYNGALKA
jgi:hypothetical protein